MYIIKKKYDIHIIQTNGGGAENDINFNLGHIT
jgi:hypothetical protein